MVRYCYTLCLLYLFLSSIEGQAELMLTPSNLPISHINACVTEKQHQLIATPTWVDKNLKVKNRLGFPKMKWPIGNQLYDNIFMMNYFDQSNPGTADGVFTDYNCGHDLGYDGHTGTDITLFNFRLMDIGIPILAASDGVVANIVYDEFDRHYNPPYSSNQANIVRVRHDDGSHVVYVHMRKNSISVNKGEQVKAGQFLGYVASSGSSPVPHLHIEFWKPGSISWPNIQYRDPWEGTCHREESLWEDQLDYVPSNDIWIMDSGISTEPAIGGNINRLTDIPFKDRVAQPKVFGKNEPLMLAWIQLQSPPGQSYRIDIHKPNGSQFATSGTINIQNYIRYWWHPYAWSTGSLTKADYGTWSMKIYTNGQLYKENKFEVGETSYFAPRFYPQAGKSFRLSSRTQTDRLRLSSLGKEATFALHNAPDYVSLNNEVVTISGGAEQEFRNAYFQVVATDLEGATDTMWYHLVDPNKPIQQLSTSISDEKEELISMELAPNPADQQANLKFSIQESQYIKIELFNLSGQLQRTIVDSSLIKPGFHQYVIDLEGIDPGMYVLKVLGEQNYGVKKLMISK